MILSMTLGVATSSYASGCKIAGDPDSELGESFALTADSWSNIAIKKSGNKITRKKNADYILEVVFEFGSEYSSVHNYWKGQISTRDGKILESQRLVTEYWGEREGYMLEKRKKTAVKKLVELIRKVGC